MGKSVIRIKEGKILTMCYTERNEKREVREQEIE